MNTTNRNIEARKKLALITLISLVIILGGAWVFSTPMNTYYRLTVLFSFLILLFGIVETYYLLANRCFLRGWQWYLAASFTKTVLGLTLILYI